MPNPEMTLTAKLNAKTTSARSIRHSSGFRIATKMPHAAFPPECRGQENAEPQSEDLSEDIGRQAFGDVFRFLRLGIIFRCSAAASIGRLKTRVAYRLVGTEPAYRSVVWFWQALPPSARGGRANKFGLFRHFRDLTRAQ